MFKFGFSDTNSTVESEDVKIEVRPVEEVSISPEGLKRSCSGLETDDIEINGHHIRSVNTSSALQCIKSDSDNDASIVDAESNHSDLTSGSYEGGLKIWECTFDIAKHLRGENLSGKNVLDLGCGSGILGILAYKQGASHVHFQDYNIGVIKHLTIPNVVLNCGDNLDKSKFWSGDWDGFSKIDMSYDLILTSETIYNPQNYKKLLSIFEQRLKKDGKIFLAGKSYYFGVGGSVKQFQDALDEASVFTHKKVWSSDIGVKREILEIILK